VPAGYADGLDTRLGNRGTVLVRGRRVPIVGAVCMDMLMIDVTGLDVSPGDPVVLIGEQDGEQITAREMATVIGPALAGGLIAWLYACAAGDKTNRGVRQSQRLDEEHPASRRRRCEHGKTSERNDEEPATAQPGDRNHDRPVSAIAGSDHGTSGVTVLSVSSLGVEG